MLEPKNAIDRLITQAKRAPKLEREEERTLLRRWQEGRDRSAADRLVQANMRHVVFIALKYRRYGVPVEELIAEGNLGLMRALDKFSADHGTRFGTYAAYWIRSFVVACVLKSRSLVGGGSGVFNTRTFFRLRRERAKARTLLGDTEAANEMVANAMSVPTEQLQQMEQRLDSQDVSLDSPLHDMPGSMLDTIGEEAEYEELEHNDTLSKMLAPMNEAFQELNERELYIVKHRLMADPDEELSLSQLGEQFGVSRERVRQLEERAKEKLRTFLNRKYRRSRRPHEAYGLVA